MRKSHSFQIATSYCRGFEVKQESSSRLCQLESQRFKAILTPLSGDTWLESLNVADDVSRGIPAQRLTGRWRQGPEFLRLPEEKWPQEASTADPNELEKERRKVQAVLLTCSPRSYRLQEVFKLEKTCQNNRLCIEIHPELTYSMPSKEITRKLH